MNNLEPVPWRGVRALEKLILVILPLAAIAVLILPFLDQFFLRRVARLSGARPIVTWLVSDFNALIAGVAILLLFGLFVLMVRFRLMRNRQLWFGAGCPECKERELVRVTRLAKDRPYGLIGVPAYRYACRNCTWRGLRIAQREYTAERIAELEASLLRFDPDAPLPPRPEVTENPPPVDDSAGLFDEAAAGELADADFLELVDDSSSAIELQAEPEEDEESSGNGNHHTEPEPVDAMEWLWRRSSES